MLHVSIVWHVEPGTRYEPNLVVDEGNICSLFDLIDATPDIRHTLLIQADDSVLSATGRSAYLFERFGSELSKLAACGHEIGWHFHPIEITRRGRWQQSSDQSRICAAAEHAFNDINFAKPITVCSTGWCYGSNELMATYRKLGLRVDCSALPGLFNPGFDVSDRYGNLGLVNNYDWRQSPSRPFNPACENYQLESSDHECTLIQFPALTTRDRLVSLNESVHWYTQAYRGVKRALMEGHDVFLQLYSHSYNIVRSNQRRHFDSHIALLNALASETRSTLKFCTVSSAIESWSRTKNSIDLRSYVGQEAQWITLGKRLMYKIGVI